MGDGQPEWSSPGEDRREEGEERSGEGTGKSSSMEEEEEGGTSSLLPSALCRPRWCSALPAGSLGGACGVIWMLGTVVK